MFLYNKQGEYIIEIDKGTEEEIKQQYGEVYISEIFLGLKAKVENGNIRAKTKIEQINDGEYELMEGEYIDENETKIIQKPSNYHYWNFENFEWIHDKEKELEELKSYLKGLDKVLFEKEDLRDRATNQNRAGAAEAFQDEINELLTDQTEKQARLDELEESEG